MTDDEKRERESSIDGGGSGSHCGFWEGYGWCKDDADECGYWSAHESGFGLGAGAGSGSGDGEGYLYGTSFEQIEDNTMKKKTTKKTGKRKPTTTRTTIPGTKVIVRTREAGVHYGTIVSRSEDGQRIVLKDSRRCFRWQIDHVRHNTSQVTCSELAKYGPHANSRMGVPLEEAEILGVIEVLPTTEMASKAIEAWPT